MSTGIVTVKFSLTKLSKAVSNFYTCCSLCARDGGSGQIRGVDGQSIVATILVWIVAGTVLGLVALLSTFEAVYVFVLVFAHTLHMSWHTT